MNLNTANLKVAAAASKDELRAGLMSIHVTPEYTEATNGHILARVGIPTQYEADEIPATLPTEPAANLKPFVIPSASLKSLKTFKSKTMPVLNDTLFIDVAKTNDNGTAFFNATDREQTSSPAIMKVDTEYPDTTRVIPTEEPTYRIGFNISYLQTLLGIATATGAGTITIDGYTNHNDRIAYLITCIEDLLGDIPCAYANAQEALEVVSSPIARNYKPWKMWTEHDNQKFTGIIMPITR